MPDDLPYPDGFHPDTTVNYGFVSPRDTDHKDRMAELVKDFSTKTVIVRKKLDAIRSSLERFLITFDGVTVNTVSTKNIEEFHPIMEAIAAKIKKIASNGSNNTESLSKYPDDTSVTVDDIIAYCYGRKEILYSKVSQAPPGIETHPFAQQCDYIVFGIRTLIKRIQRTTYQIK